jgi:hypothetical protein
MNRREIKSFAVLKCAKIGAVILAAFAALFLSPIYISILLFPIRSAVSHPPSHPPHPAPPLFFFALFPLLYGISGFLMIALACWLYNVLSPRFGRIEIELTDSVN